MLVKMLNGTLHIEIDMKNESELQPTAKGNYVIATTSGNRSYGVDGVGEVKIGVNVYTDSELTAKRAINRKVK